ncbi:hypothetical protein A7K99_13580 [Tatumella citrea]|uniref:Uncharacterized protein n=1 Tax=Tatumella citrea TaxID=53336 RepID=A0A1Y0LAP8_TATCI|nr:hypothetical protein A7K98_13595 [Tatumella citrea]ARU98736.1 hypothetical protein A7K99_13580 [Tatumella citrea]
MFIHYDRAPLLKFIAKKFIRIIREKVHFPLAAQVILLFGITMHTGLLSVMLLSLPFFYDS